MGKHVSLKDFDWLLFVLLLLISALGVVEIYSTTAHTKFAGAHVKQIYWILIGVSLMFLVCRYDYHDLLNHIPLIYILTLVALGALLLLGSDISGARRWIRVGGFSFQVSEAVKLAIILLLARFFSESQEERVSLPEMAMVFLAVGVPGVLVAMQPDLGTALTLVPIVMVTLFLAGMQWRYFGMLLLAGLMILPVGLHYLKPYQKARIATFMNPEQDPQKAGYQLLQSKIAVGSGQLWGKGTAQGTQTQLWFLPEPHTDFIFAAYAEEQGFLGVLFALLLYLFVLMRLVHNAKNAPDAGGMFIIGGVVAVLSFQILVNIGMVVGYAPVTGIPLPLMSYGGSSVLFIFLSMGLVNSVRVRRFVN